MVKLKSYQHTNDRGKKNTIIISFFVSQFSKIGRICHALIIYVYIVVCRPNLY